VATWYVDGDNGSDLWTGATDGHAAPDGAKATVQSAIGAASSGDSIYIQNNGATVYNEAINLGDKRLWLRGYGSSPTDNTRAVLDGTGLSTGGVGGVKFTMATNGPGIVRLWNLLIQDYRDGDHNVDFRRTAGSGYVMLETFNCRVTNADAAGVYINSSSIAFRAINCRFDNNDWWGVTAQGLAAYFAACEIDNNGVAGYDLTYGGCLAYCLIHDNVSGAGVGGMRVNCLTYGNGGPGVNYDSAGSDVLGWGVNVLNGDVGNDTYGLESDSSPDAAVLNCGFYSNSSGAYPAGVTPDLARGTVTADPDLVAPGSGDFRPSPGSPWLMQELTIGLLDSGIKAYPDIGPLQRRVIRRQGLRTFA
jgi:hypothetical protein